MRILLVVCLAFFLPMCSGSVDQNDGGNGVDVEDASGGDDAGGGGDDGNGGDRGPPPLLDTSHLGWKSQHCDSCHTLPRPGHTTANPADCAACHGGNGSCGPNFSNHQHQRTDHCVGCHQNKHDFNSSPDCANCHFAFAATVDCNESTDGGVDGGGGDGDGGLVLSDALTDNCFNWPQDEFATDNRASNQTALAEGSLAVEFTMLDVDGNPFTLSDLLTSRPVLLVFGAYT